VLTGVRTAHVGRHRRAGVVRGGPEVSKRALDVLVSGAAIVLLAPLLVALCMLVRASSPGPALFRQERLGRNLRPFTLLKLRTMYTGNDDRVHRAYVTSLLWDERPEPGGGAGLYKLAGDRRVTRLGRFLRRTSLDELPQFLNVLGGQMSLVGPRPVLVWEADMFSEADRQRFHVKPGLTGLWQVSGRSRLTMRDALRLDVEYVQRWSLGLDLQILVRTVPALLRGEAT
jgi:lipopolysaccharide/colanic/teichoic acid biosynthesis glycosyltransferase